VLVRSALTAVAGSLPDADLFERTLAAFDQCYRENLFRASHLYPGVAPALNALRSKGLILGCVTNKREVYARELLQRAGIADSLSFIHGGDTFSARKPDPVPLLQAAQDHHVAVEECVLIGDSGNDRRAAMAAGFAFIFAAYGYSPADDPQLTDGFGVISSFAGLPELLCPPRAGK
jgi:phosphoglycolate phosphatase